MCIGNEKASHLFKLFVSKNIVLYDKITVLS